MGANDGWLEILSALNVFSASSVTFLSHSRSRMVRILVLHGQNVRAPADGQFLQPWAFSFISFLAHNPKPFSQNLVRAMYFLYHVACHPAE